MKTIDILTRLELEHSAKMNRIQAKLDDMLAKHMCSALVVQTHEYKRVSPTVVRRRPV